MLHLCASTISANEKTFFFLSLHPNFMATECDERRKRLSHSTRARTISNCRQATRILLTSNKYKLVSLLKRIRFDWALLPPNQHYQQQQQPWQHLSVDWNQRRLRKKVCVLRKKSGTLFRMNIWEFVCVRYVRLHLPCVAWRTSQERALDWVVEWKSSFNRYARKHPGTRLNALKYANNAKNYHFHEQNLNICSIKSF